MGVCFTSPVAPIDAVRHLLLPGLLLWPALGCAHRGPGTSAAPSVADQDTTAPDAAAIDETRQAPPPSRSDAEAASERPPASGRSDDVLIIRAKAHPPPDDGSIPKVRAGTVTVGPAYPPELLRRVMRTRVPELRLCYASLQSSDADARGRGQLSFTIGSDGAVAAASLTMGFDAPELVDCVLSVMRATRFPEPPGGGQLIVTYPLVFIPEGEPTEEDLRIGT
jgi:outer membrane biosynthesis protein TonB